MRMRCPRCGAPNVRGEICDVCGVSLRAYMPGGGPGGDGRMGMGGPRPPRRPPGRGGGGGVGGGGGKTGRARTLGSFFQASVRRVTTPPRGRRPAPPPRGRPAPPMGYGQDGRGGGPPPPGPTMQRRGRLFRLTSRPVKPSLRLPALPGDRALPGGGEEAWPSKSWGAAEPGGAYPAGGYGAADGDGAAEQGGAWGADGGVPVGAAAGDPWARVQAPGMGGQPWAAEPAMPTRMPESWSGPPALPRGAMERAPMPYQAPRPVYAQVAQAARRFDVFSLGHTATSALMLAGALLLLGIPVLFGLARLSSIVPHDTATSTAAATRVPTAAPPGGFTAFMAADYSVAYPSGWTHTTQTLATDLGTAQTEAFGDGKQAQTRALVGELSPVPTDQLQTAVDAVAKVVIPSHLPQVMGTAQHVTYGNVPWLADDYSVTQFISNGRVTYQLRVLAANYGTHTYIVVLQAPQGSFGNADRGQFEPLLRSFRFG